MILCITEKPSVGRDIARIIGATQSHAGYMEGNGYCVTWTFGHLCTLKDPADYTEVWKRWALSSLPMIPSRFGIKVMSDPGVQAQFNVIKTLIGQCEEIVNCGDAGQEGEVIQRWVMQKAGCDKPIKRLWISSLTDDAVREGFRHLREHKELDSLYTAGICRAIGDWILGINATRLYSLKYGLKGQILSVGRVQTPTLALVVQRQKEIDEFIPKDYWELKTRYRGILFSAQVKGFDNEAKGNVLLEDVKQYPLVIEDVQRKKGREAPPRLFDLTALQVEANRKYGLSADKTLQTIQSLYEKKLTTYPRVDTTYLTDDMYQKCPDILRSLKPYSNLTQPILGAKLKKDKKVFDNSKVTDHHAIIPTGQALPSNLLPDEKRVFHLIAQRFISAFYPDCTFEQTVVTAKAGKTGFKTTGKIILDSGWRKVYDSKDKDDPENNGSDDDRILPDFQKGESGPHEPLLVKKTTNPPKYYTEGTLLKAMETAGSNVEDEELREALKANGIGRPSTRAAIIETLYKRGYIRQERKSLRATQAGIELIGVIREELLKSAALTGIWEGRLRAIEGGTYSAAEFIDQLKKMINEIIYSVMTDNSNRRIIAEVPDPDAGDSKEKGKKVKKVKKDKKETKS